MKVVRSSLRSLVGLFRLVGGAGARGDASRHAVSGDVSGESRERLIRRILSTIHNNSILVCGRPASGKTSLLLDLKERLARVDDPATAFFPVYIELHGVSENLLFATVADAVLGQLGFAPPTKVERFGADYSHRDLANDFRGVIQALDKSGSKQARLVLLVDGIDVLNGYDPRTTQRVRSLFMASLSENLVMVGSAVAIDKSWDQEGSPWYNFFEEIELRPTHRQRSNRDRMQRNG
jgi:hypothetical protein